MPDPHTHRAESAALGQGSGLAAGCATSRSSNVLVHPIEAGRPQFIGGWLTLSVKIG